jgi:hypothetical protein
VKPKDSRNSGGASPPRATVTGGAWVHAPPQEKTQQQGGLDRLLPLFFSSPAVKINVTCNQKKTHKQSVLVIFLDLFPSAFHPCLLHFLLSQVCSWGFVVFSSASGTWAAAGGDLDRSVMAAGRRCWRWPVCGHC